MIEQNNQKNTSQAWWQPGVALFFELWGWLVWPIVIALFVGSWLDKKFQTAPILFFVTVGLAFVITIYGLVRQSLRVMKELDTKKDNTKQGSKINE